MVTFMITFTAAAVTYTACKIAGDIIEIENLFNQIERNGGNKLW